MATITVTATATYEYDTDEGLASTKREAEEDVRSLLDSGRITSNDFVITVVKTM